MVTGEQSKPVAYDGDRYENRSHIYHEDLHTECLQIFPGMESKHNVLFICVCVSI